MTQHSIKRSITMEMWCKLSKDDAAPPVTICLEGDSMRPLIRRGKDPVTIVPLRRNLKKGDTVLFHLGNRYIVHRVWKIEKDRVCTFGDNCYNPDPWIPVSDVLGLVIKYTRNGKKHSLDSVLARTWGRIWMAIHPLRITCKRLRSLAGRVYRKVFHKYERR